MYSTDLRKAAGKCLIMYGVIGISMFAADVPDVESLLKQAPPGIVRYASIMFASVGNIRDLGPGFGVVPTFDAPHYTVTLPDLEEKSFEMLRGAMIRLDNPLYIRH